ncbi:MAG: LysM peptidoglycan-binding domain-containing protein [Chloroflexota bacterium]
MSRYASVATLEHLVRLRPRYLLHGVVAAVGVAALSSFAFQPRQADAPATAMPAAPLEEVAPMVALNVEPLAPPTEVMVEEPAAAKPEPEVAPAPAPPKPTVYTVEEGETLGMLAERFNVSAETIMAANGLRDADMLKVGQDLIILPSDGVLYVVKAGESIRGVAERLGVDTMDIVTANDLGADPDVVQAGTMLMVPGATPVVGSPSNTTVVRGDEADQAAVTVGGGAVVVPIEVTTRATPSARTYTVQPGDTLVGIADTFGVDVSTLLSSNGIDDPDTIKPGSELRILPVKGVEYSVQPNETLADIAGNYQVDLGLLLDYNDLSDPDVINIGAKLMIPGGKLRPQTAPAAAPAPVVEAPATRTQSAGAAAPAVVQAPAPSKPVVAAAVSNPAPAPKPAAAPKPAPAPAPAPAAPELSAGGGGGTIVANAMKYVGYRYVFGGTSPAGFDCSGFVYYIHNHSGAPVGRGMWQQYNGGAHISMSALQPGDTVFFANTYMPGLSHDGIYIGGGQFVHASDERTGVTVSSIYSSYWQGHYAGATRLWD